MSTATTELYRNWTITIKAEKNLCANFSFDVTDPTGKTQHVSMGGDNVHRAMERAREMIDSEISFQNDE